MDDDELIDPRASARKQRDVEAERRKKAIQEFQQHHPLARLYTMLTYLGWAREDKQWRYVGQFANWACSAYANLSEQEKESLTDALPNPPPYLGEWSTYAWIAYLASLWASRSHRERLRETVSHAIVDGWGADFLPDLIRTVHPSSYGEPPF